MGHVAESGKTCEVTDFFLGKKFEERRPLVRPRQN